MIDTATRCSRCGWLITKHHVDGDLFRATCNCRREHLYTDEQPPTEWNP